MFDVKVGVELFDYFLFCFVSIDDVGVFCAVDYLVVYGGTLRVVVYCVFGIEYVIFCDVCRDVVYSILNVLGVV